jgi:hypothetical protein
VTASPKHGISVRPLRLGLVVGIWAIAFGIFISPLAASAAESPTQTIAIGQVLRGRFVQERHLAGFASPLRSEGSFVLVPGTGLIWRGEKPFPNTTVLSPNGILQLANNQEALRLPASRLPGLSHLYETLGAAVSGDIKPLQQTFTVVQEPGTQWKIILTPLHPDNPAMAQLKSLALTGGRFVDTVDVDKGTGDIDHITFLDQHVEKANLTADEKKLFALLRK